MRKSIMCCAWGIGMVLLAASTAGAAELVAEYKFNSVVDNRTDDTSGKGNSALVRGPRPVNLGSVKGLLFDGIDDAVDCGSGSSLDLDRTVSVECLVRPDALPSTEVGIAGKGTSPYGLTYYKDGKCWWYISGGGNAVAARLQVGNVYHVVGTYDDKVSRLYIDGKQVGSKELNVPIKSGGKFYVGFKEDTTGSFNGVIAAVRVYDYALTAKVIATRFGELSDQSLRQIAALQDGQDLTAKGFRVRVGALGGLQINVGQDRYNIESHLSYAGKSIGWNDLGARGPTCEAQWQPKVTDDQDGSLAVTAAGKHYALQRKVQIADHRIIVTDSLTNISNQDVAIIYRNDLVTPVPFKKHLLCGVEQADSFSAENPSAVIFQTASRLGWLVEDTVLRLQHNFVASRNRVRLATQKFALKPGKTYSFRWAIYPMQAGADYWTFINQVRRDWDVNFQMLGSWTNLYLTKEMDLIRDPAALKKYLTRLKVAVVGFSPWVDYENYHSALARPVLREELKVLAQEAMAAVKAVDPTILCIGSLETGNVSPPEDVRAAIVATMPGSPQNIYTFTPEQLDILKKFDVPWKDSLLQSRDGKYRFEHYLRGPLDDRFPMIAVLVVPVVDNGYYQVMMDQVKFLLEDIGLDGIYIDQFNMAFNDTNRFSFDKWDGTTVDVDKQTGQITKRYTDAGLVSIPARTNLVNYVTGKKRYMLANTFPTNLDMQSLRIHRFNESEWVFEPLSWADDAKPPWQERPCESHLSTPISLGVRPGRYGQAGTDNYAKIIIKTVIAYLRHGMLFYHYDTQMPETGPGSGEYGPINHMFPLTPVELHEGYIVGKERTVTAISGTYHWNNSDKPKVRVFDITGRPKKAGVTMQSSGDSWVVKIKLDDWQNIAVIAAR